MSAPDTFDRFLLDAQTELRRAYAGSLRSTQVPAAVAEALHYARGNQRRLQRLANPVGYLYRVGTSRTSARPSGFVAWSHEDGPSADPDPAQAMAELPGLEGSAVWLVRGCGWTNVQAAEALGISSPALAAAATAGHEQLGQEIGAAGLDDRLRALAWLVGIVETAQTTYVFAYNVALADGAANTLESVPSAAERLAVVEALLASAGVIEG